MYINFWYPICTSESLDEESPQRVEMLGGIRLVAFRDEDPNGNGEADEPAFNFYVLMGFIDEMAA